MDTEENTHLFTGAGKVPMDHGMGNTLVETNYIQLTAFAFKFWDTPAAWRRILIWSLFLEFSSLHLAPLPQLPRGWLLVASCY